MSVRRMLPFILVNIVISAVVVLAILYWWDNRNNDEAPVAEVETAVTPTPFRPASVPVAGAQSTDTPPPADEPIIHVVTAGETLGNISEFYEVPMEDIMAVNGISNPNILSVGEQLIIPVGGIPTATPVPTDEPTATIVPSPIPTEPLAQGEANVEITAVIGVAQLDDEAVQIRNIGDAPVALLGWKLSDQNGQVYTFGQVTLFGGGTLLVHTSSGSDGANDVHWGREEPVWESGELVTLVDGEDEIRATYEVP